MTQYRGYYIDKVVFNSKSEIDEFIKNREIEAYKTACKLFSHFKTLEYSIYCSELAEKLNKTYDISWDELEEMEIEAYQIGA